MGETENRLHYDAVADLPIAPQPSVKQERGPDPNDPPWTLGGAFLVWFLSICLIVALPVLFLIPYLMMKFRGGTADSAAILNFILTDKTAVLLQVIALLPSHLLTLFMVWALVTRFGKRPFWSAIGWGWGRIPPLAGTAICVGLGIFFVIVGSFIAWLLGGGKPTTLEQIINSSLAARYLIAFFAVVSAPVVEEFVYRGILYSPLQRLLGVPAAVVIVLVLFTIVHVPQYQSNIGVIAAVGLLSIALTVIRAYTGRLLPCVIIHLVFNGIQATTLILEPHLSPVPPTTEPITPTLITMFLHSIF